MARYMNPYNFVRLRPMAEEARQVPLGHRRLVSEHRGERVYSGRLHGLITAFGPLMVLSHDPADVVTRGEHKHFTRFFHYPGDPRPVIPGSSLKGMVRAVAEAACNGCLSILNEVYVNRWDDFDEAYPPSLRFCGRADAPGASESPLAPKRLCPTCRVFGTAPEGEESGIRQRGAYPHAFQGKVRFHDALLQGALRDIYAPPATLIPLMEPKVSDRVWYHNPQWGTPGYPLAGRKFYYHHDDLRPKTTDRATPYNTTITPLKAGATFTFTIDFRNLLESELDLLLYALELEPARELIQVDGESIAFDWQRTREFTGVYPKLGYGKPAGLGSVCILVTGIDLLDPAGRYTGDRGWQASLTGNAARRFVEAGKRRFRLAQSILQDGKRYRPVYLSDLRHILRFPNGIRRFRYPSLDEFRRYREAAQKLPLPGREARWEG